MARLTQEELAYLLASVKRDSEEIDRLLEDPTADYIENPGGLHFTPAENLNPTNVKK